MNYRAEFFPLIQLMTPDLTKMPVFGGETQLDV
jgi:hypothetical protein